jgi:heavy metal sensor kinase
MRFEDLSGIFRSLRFRLTGWNTVVVLLTVVATLFGVREGLRRTLLREIDNLLSDDAQEVRLAIEQLSPDQSAIVKEMTRKATGHADRGLFLRLVDGKGQVIYSSPRFPELKEHPRSTSTKPRLVHTSEYRLALLRLEKPKPYEIQVGSDLNFIEEDVSRLTDQMLIAGMAILVLAPLGGYWLAGRATQPLAHINTTAAGLRPSHMEERLPIRGTGDELDLLSITINKFLDLIGEYLERNREFVANAAHELRSPLAAIQSSVEVTLNSDRTVEEYKALLEEIYDECNALGTLVNQLLLLAENDSGDLEVVQEPVSLDRLVKTSLDMFGGAAEERGIDLQVRRFIPVTVLGDGNRIRQVINNLIDNSLKFTPSRGQVLVDLEQDLDSRLAILRVSDTGSGIPADDVPHIFERFYRGDKSRRRENPTRGSGLGLSICQSIVHAHGGDIQVQSRVGRGAQFTVYLPLAPADSVPVEAPANDATGALS